MIAKRLGQCSSLLYASHLLPRLHRRRADLAAVAGRRYLNVAGAGFDSEVNRIANQRLRWARGRVRYVGAVLAQLAVGRPAGFQLTLDGQQREVRAWLVAVANGPSYGGGMRVAYQAGVLRALDEAGLAFDHADGTSGRLLGKAVHLVEELTQVRLIVHSLATLTDTRVTRHTCERLKLA